MDLTFDDLRAKWRTVPGSSLGRIQSDHLLTLPDDRLLGYWEECRREIFGGLAGYRDRGWLCDAYGDWAKGRKIIEVGSGLGFDAVMLTEMGARLTVSDIVKSNLDVVRRIFALKGLPAPDAIHLISPAEDLDRLDNDYDAVFAFGSLHNAPIALMKPEYDALARRLKPRGRFLFFAYPKQRWIDEGEMPFTQWGEKTDGTGTPWVEWYDAKKIIDRLRPAHFECVCENVFRDGAMNCIDLIKTDGVADLAPDSIAATSQPVLTARGRGLAEFAREVNEAAGLDIQSHGLLIDTPAVCWSSAVSFPFDGLQPGLPMSLRLRIATIKGRLGLGILPADSEDFLIERYVEPLSDTADGGAIDEVVLHFTPTSPLIRIMIRNAHAGNQPSQARLLQLDIFVR